MRFHAQTSEHMGCSQNYGSVSLIDYGTAPYTWGYQKRTQSWELPIICRGRAWKLALNSQAKESLPRICQYLGCFQDYTIAIAIANNTRKNKSNSNSIYIYVYIYMGSS